MTKKDRVCAVQGKMIYDVKSEYYQSFLSSKQGATVVKDKRQEASGSENTGADGDAMDTED